MEARELRIGNVIIFRSRMVTVKGLYNPHDTGMTVYINEEQYGYPITEFEPAELTDYILENTGFKCIGRHGWDGSYGFNLYTSPSGKEILPCYREQIASDVPLKYLHQLQNCFYALTNTELPITL